MLFRLEAVDLLLELLKEELRERCLDAPDPDLALAKDLEDLAEPDLEGGLELGRVMIGFLESESTLWMLWAFAMSGYNSERAPRADSEHTFVCVFDRSELE